jgi:hypothetical protein
MSPRRFSVRAVDISERERYQLTKPDSRLDLINRRLKAQSARLKSRAVDLIPKGLRTPAGGGILLVEDEDEDEDGNELRRRKPGDKYRKEVEKEVERFKVKVSQRPLGCMCVLTRSSRRK